MHAFILQDWTTVRGGTTTVTQAEREWLDLELYQDVIFWLQVSEQTGSPTLAYQTSPNKDESLFSSLLASPISVSVTASARVSQILMLSASVPLARYVRWQLAGTPTWDATFRIVVAASGPGL
jgi:hypothetical protein